MNNVVLIFSPHPDDVELAMGGTVIRMIEEGWQVIIADVTDGEPTPKGSPEIRAAEREKATQALGVTERVCLGLPNRYVTNNIENRKVLAEAVRRFKPRWLFTTYRPDAHPDHIQVGRLTDEARFTAKLTKTDMKYEPHYAEKIIYYYATHLHVHPQPSFVVDVSNQWEQKIEAVKAYKSQFWDNQPDTKQGWIVEHLSCYCGYFGNRIGVKYGEPFFCHELVGLNSLKSLL
jgi:bacillithiol biosynthesis deacetylase BshB1